LVSQELKKHPNYKGKFSQLATNYFGYEGRCAFPTTFDCDYCYSLGLNAGAIIQAGFTGLMSCVRNLEK
jgi:6-phosphofructokinase